MSDENLEWDHESTNSTSKRVKLTYYWQVREADYSTGGSTGIYTCEDKLIKKVNDDFYKNLHLEGSGKLTNNQYVNCNNDNCTCFKLTQSPLGNHQNELHFLSSIASRNIDYGQKLIIQEFVNLTLANGETHNGCFIVDDTGYSLGQDHLDMYTVTKEAYNWLDDKLNLEKVTILMNQDCQIKRYTVEQSSHVN